MKSLKRAIRSLRPLLRFDNRVQLLCERIFFRRNPLSVCRRNGVVAVVDHRTADAGSIYLCLTTDAYTRFLSRMQLDRPLTVADLGANVGGFSLLLRAAGYKVERLLCVEMNPNTWTRLSFNIQINYRDIAPAVVNAAVCAEARSIDIELGAGSTTDSIHTGAGGVGKWRRRYTVQGMSLDQLLDDHFADAGIDICKIDIEGAEAEVLLDPASRHTALRRCRYVLIELHPVDRYDALCEAFDRLGFDRLADDGQDRCGVHLFANRQLTQSTDHQADDTAT